MKTDNNQLIKYFQELYNIEKGARDLYNEFISELIDVEEIEQIKKIRDDENKHMEIVGQIISIIRTET